MIPIYQPPIKIITVKKEDVIQIENDLKDYLCNIMCEYEDLVYIHENDEDINSFMDLVRTGDLFIDLTPVEDSVSYINLPFDHSFAKELIDDIHQCRVDAILEGQNGTYFENDDSIVDETVKKIKDHNIKHNLCDVRSFYDDSFEFDKFVIWTNENSDFPKFHKKYLDKFDFIQREENFYELVPIGYSKATGIEFLLEHLGIDFDNTYALGDSTNDLSMLRYVKHSIAMGNSNPILFDLVSYVTTDIEEDGVFNALKYYGII